MLDGAATLFRRESANITVIFCQRPRANNRLPNNSGQKPLFCTIATAPKQVKNSTCTTFEKPARVGRY